MNYRGRALMSSIEGVGQSPVEADGGVENFRGVTVTEWLHEDLLKRAGLLVDTESAMSVAPRVRAPKTADGDPLNS